MRLYEDLHALGRSKKFVNRVDIGISVLNTQNRRHGIKARRGDGSFGEIVPNVHPIKDKGLVVCRGPIATIEIGVEVKILMKAMIKQVDRVINDLKGQATHIDGARAIRSGVTFLPLELVLGRVQLRLPTGKGRTPPWKAACTLDV